MATTTAPRDIGEGAGALFEPAESAAAHASHTGDVIKARMPAMVKGAGYAGPGGNTPLTDAADIATRTHNATMALRTETWRGYNAKSDVVNKGFNQGFLNQFGNLKTALTMPSIQDQIGQLVVDAAGRRGRAEVVHGRKSWYRNRVRIGAVNDLGGFAG